MSRLLTLLAATALSLAGCAGGVVAHSVPVTTPRPAVLSGDLYRPGGAGPFPAVILLHGCSGPAANGTAWAHWLQAEGYAALTLDSFAGRQLTRLCGDSSALTGAARSGDVFAAAFLVHYHLEGDPWEAAAAATCAASLSVEGEGWSAVPGRAALDAALARYRGAR